jgi:hypothetical protein
VGGNEGHHLYSTPGPTADSHDSLPELSLAYNGGKDCLVLLILYLCALHKRGLTKTPNPSSHIETAVQCVYIQDTHPFAEVEEFVARSIKTYSLSLLEYAKPMKAAFSDYLRDTPSVKAILVGTRRTDPHGEHLKHFDPTDKGWPAFVRIHPVIDWHYVDVWTVSCSGLAHNSPADLRSSFVTSTYLIAAFMILDTPHSEALLIPTQIPRLLARLHHNKSHRSPTRTEQNLRRENLNSGPRTNWLMTMKNAWEETIEI